MINTKADLALYFRQDLATASRLPLSEVNALFECSAYQNWKKSQENQNKGLSAILGGINNVIKGLNMLGGVLSRRPRR
jgi:hypothetical protein